MGEREPVADGRPEVSVTAGESGAVIVLCGETDAACNAQLSALLVGQLSRGIRQLTVDVSGLRGADPGTVRALVLAALTLQDRGGSLVLLRPQEPLAGVLALTGAERLFTIWEPA
jgi:anti-anti-sigma factor